MSDSEAFRTTFRAGYDAEGMYIMSEAKHTSGPFTYHSDHDEYGQVILDRNGDPWFMFTDGVEDSIGQMFADAPDMAAEIARLKEINAELIHALREVRGFMGDVCAPEYYWNLVNPAIAKAEQL